MARIEKTVFISYRRTDVYTALAVYENLKNQGYDVFFDYRSISSGDFEQIITSNIKARAHFLLILTPTALDRCNEPGDWLRREIEFAIDEKRNIIPLFFRGFRFGDSSVTEKLTGKLRNLSRYNGLNVHEDYFDEAMQRLRTQYLNIPLTTVLHPVSTEVLKVVREEQVAADKALEQIPDVQELVKQDQEEHIQRKAEPTPKRNKPVSATAGVALPREKAAEKLKERPSKIAVPRTVIEKPFSGPSFNFRLISEIAAGLLILGLLIWGASNLYSNLSAAPEPTQTLQTSVISLPQLTATTVSQSEPISTSTPTAMTIPAIPTLGVGSTMTGKDGMTLLYVPAGEFTMGSDNGQADEKPAHKVALDAFWIDRTEVTNAMYANCVADGKCNPPSSAKSFTRDSYYGNDVYDNFPVIYVTWNDAQAYCTWAGRKLPTEAQWEKSARGTDGRAYPWGNSAPKPGLLNYDKPSGDTIHVGQYLQGDSPYGALDMAGNVWEWVADWYDSNYYSVVADSIHNPSGPASGAYRVARGGAWSSYINSVSSFSRLRFDPMNSNPDIGFRCAMSATP